MLWEMDRRSPIEATFLPSLGFSHTEGEKGKREEMEEKRGEPEGEPEGDRMTKYCLKKQNRIACMHLY